MMMIPKWGNYPGDGGGGITLVNEIMRRLRLLGGSRTAPLTRCITTRHRFRTLDNQRQRI